MGMSWESVRSHFPVMEHTTYLNSSAVGPMPDFLADAHLRAFQNRVSGPRRDDAALAQQRAGRERMAQYLRVSPDDLAFMGTTTEAINIVAHSLSWQTGDEVVVHDHDFPSNLLPWVRLRERGVVVKQARSDGGRLSVQAVLDQVTARTRVVALSHVFYQTGYRVDLDALGAELHRRGVLLSVDGIQALGLIRPSLTHVDFYMGATFKSLLGSFGLAMLYVRPDVADRLIPSMVGYASLISEEIPSPGEPFVYKAGAQRFQLSHVNTPGLYVLADTLEFFESLGWDAITDRVLALSGSLVEALDHVAGVTVITPRESSARLGIVAFDVDGLDSEEVVGRLDQAGIVCAAREGHVRASVHVYNNEADVMHLVRTVADLAR
jgi:selenocysteine lyase/cysteine desulfurase